jgi:hypothetical protein
MLFATVMTRSTSFSTVTSLVTTRSTIFGTSRITTGLHGHDVIELGDALLRGIEARHRVARLVAAERAHDRDGDAAQQRNEKRVLLHGMSPFAQRMCTSMSSPSTASMNCWKARPLCSTARCMRL